jgi:hypothetical protein
MKDIYKLLSKIQTAHRAKGGVSFIKANPLVLNHLNCQNSNIQRPGTVAFGSSSLKHSKRGGRSSLDSTLKKPISAAHQKMRCSSKNGRHCPQCDIHKIPGSKKCNFSSKNGCKVRKAGFDRMLNDQEDLAF